MAVLGCPRISTRLAPCQVDFLAVDFGRGGFLAGEAVNIGGAAGGENSRGNLVETFGPKMLLFIIVFDSAWPRMLFFCF